MKSEVFRSIANHKMENNLDEIKSELILALSTLDQPKDILIVVRDQLEYVQNCLTSVFENTENFHVYVWDNGSQEETRDYLRSFTDRENFHLIRVNKNEGFNEPNNRLAELTTSPYIILLNSDTIVYKGWDRLMLGFLTRNPKIKIVGFGGSFLNEEFKGGPAAFGADVDYVSGWGLCISRETYNQFGLFDETNLHFAYCEDSDLSLRVREAGHGIYVFYSDLVIHFENKTVQAAVQDPVFKVWFSQMFEKNHNYMRSRWEGKGLLKRERNTASI